MTAAALALAWALVVVAGAARRRPAPARLRSLARAPRTGGGRVSPVIPAARRRFAELVERLGGRVLRRAGRPATPLSARRLGAAMLAALATLPVMPIAALPAALVAWSMPGMRAGRAEQRRRATVAADLPDVVDLLGLAVGAGLTVHLAVAHVARRGSGPLAAELARVVDEVALGRRLADALDDLPSRCGEAVRPLVASLVASERYGAPLAAGLERLADEVRRDRRRRAEEAARKVPVKLLFPLVTCTLPAFGLLTVAPLIASAVRSLRL